ncbi:MAG: hypothetical protein ACI9OJ_003306 [Myxococcota bacterium]
MTLSKLNCAIALVVLSLSACDTEDTFVADTSQGGTDGTDGTDGTSGTTATDGTASTDGTDATTGTDATETLADLPNACEAASECGGDECVENVCVIAAPAEATLVNNEDDSDVSGPPNLDCVGSPYTPGASGPDAVTLYGIVDRFGSGRKTIDIEVSIFLASEWPPAECTSKPFDEQRECFRTVKPSNAGWVTISTDPEADSPQNPSQCVRHADCTPGFECAEVDIEFECKAEFGLYEIAGIPTNTELVIRSRNDVSQPLLEGKWKDTYTLGVYLFSDKAEAGDRYRNPALMVSTGQWQTVPNTLQVGSISEGNSAIGGRTRDCHTADRRGYTIGDASVGLARPGTATGYFNDNEADTVPITNSTSTDIFGRFTVVDVPPGINRVSAVAMVGGAQTSLGHEDLYVIPDALMIVTLPGKLPILTK